MNPVEWRGSTLRFIDQTLIPAEERYVETKDIEVVAEAIESLRIRGAPLIGIAAAYALALAVIAAGDDRESLDTAFAGAANRLERTRPTAVNLFWGIRRMRKTYVSSRTLPPAEIRRRLVAEAIAIHRDDAERCAAIGRNGSALVPDPAVVLTHCNTGALATGGEGTAQAIITRAAAEGKQITVYADETRPLFQGARLTAWELEKAGIDVRVITDNTAAFLMQRTPVSLVVVGADRVAANGDTANKIGTYNLALIAQAHKVPFYVAAPTSTVDLSLPDGNAIPIEERRAEEITEPLGKRVAPSGAKVYAPAFDVTPNALITAIVTETGVIRPPFAAGLARAVNERRTRE